VVEQYLGYILAATDDLGCAVDDLNGAPDGGGKPDLRLLNSAFGSVVERLDGFPLVNVTRWRFAACLGWIVAVVLGVLLGLR
jgi:hypothetical protein